MKNWGVTRVVFIHPSILWHNRQTITHLVLRPKLRNHHGDFICQIIKPWYAILRPKLGNPNELFCGQTTRTVATSFETKPGETVDLDFEAKPRNSRSSSPCAWCRPHIASPELLIIQPPSTWPMLDHPWSSAPSLILLPRSSSLPAMPHLSPTHHETSKCASPHKIDSRVEPPKFLIFKFKPRYWPLGFSISLLISTLTTQRHKIWILNPRQHEAQLEDQKPKKNSRMSSRRTKNRKTNKWQENRQTIEKAKKSSN
jgi:hypothetical protein